MEAEQMTMVLDEKKAKDFRDIGMERSASKAERTTPGWKERAFGCIVSFPGKTFMIEDIRSYAYMNGLPKPPDERAWGSIVTYARKVGIIKQIGYKATNNAAGHRHPAAEWEKV